MIRRALLIANPASRRGDGQLASALRAFDRAGVACDVVLTERAGHAAELATAHHPGYDAVFSLGGDGTMMEIASALAGTGYPIGVLPGGTGNLLARAVGIPLRVDRAVASLLNGRERLIDLGSLGQARHFAVAAGIGIDATMLLTTPIWLKRYVGVLAYAITGTLAATRAIARRDLIDVRLTIDGVTERLTVTTIFVANFGSVLGDRITLGPGISPNDGQLDVCMFAPRSLVGGIGIMWRLMTKGFVDHPAMIYRRGAHIRIETDPPRQAQADGEMIGVTPLEISVVPRAVKFLVP